MLCQPWATDLEGCNPPEADPAVIEDALAAASEILYTLSGRQFPGLCETVFRPCGSHCNCEYDRCGCNRLPRVFLGWDVASVTEVSIDDDPPLDSTAYRLEGAWLVRLDGGTWPCCQDLAADIGEEGAFAVTGFTGAEPSVAGVKAVKELATELVKACTNTSGCALPVRVTSIVKQGTSFVLLDPMDFLQNGRTGIYFVDLFLATANPNGLQRPSTVWSPDLPYTYQYPVASS